MESKELKLIFVIHWNLMSISVESHGNAGHFRLKNMRDGKHVRIAANITYWIVGQKKNSPKWTNSLLFNSYQDILK